MSPGTSGKERDTVTDLLSGPPQSPTGRSDAGEEFHPFPCRIPIPLLDRDAAAQARARWDRLAKPRGSLGRLEELGIQLAAITGQVPPRLGRKAVVLMAGDHGVVDEGVSAYPGTVTARMVRTFLAGRAAVNALARQAGARLICVDVGVREPLPPGPGPDAAAAANSSSAQVGPDPWTVRWVPARVRPGTGNLVREPAMTREESRLALGIGLRLANQLADEGYGLLAAGEMGIGNTTASAAVVAAMLGLDPQETVGPGTGLDPQGVRRKVAVVRRALQLHRPDPRDPLDVLAKVGGLELAALAGLLVGAASRRVAVVLDGVVVGAAALVAEALAPGSRQYWLASHRSPEPAHRHVLAHLGMQPYLDLGLRLGEGTGALLAFHLVDAAVRLMEEMASLEDVLR